MLKVIVKRSKWLRGKFVKKGGYLLHPTSKRMCCLGFLAREMGYKPCEIKGVDMPTFVENTNKFPTSIVFNDKNTNLCKTMMTINDNPNITDEQREAELKPLFKQAGIGIKFED